MKSAFLFLFSIIPLVLWGQNTQQFRGFGSNPTKAHDSLFVNIQQAGNFENEYKATVQLIDYHEKVGNLDSVIYYGKQLNKKVKKQSNDVQKLAYLSNIIGQAKLNKGLVDDALEYYLNGMEQAKNLDNQSLFYQNRLGVALSKIRRNNTEDGLQMIQECITHAPNEKVKYDAINAHGQLLFSQGKIQKAEAKFQEAYTFYKQNSYAKDALNMRLQLANILAISDQKQTALEEYFAIHREASDQSFYDLYISSAKEIGTTYSALNDFDNAQKVLSTVYINAIQWDNLTAQKEVLKTLHHLHKEKGDYKNAYAIMTQLRSVDRSILERQNKAQVNELEVQYKTFEKEQEITRQKTQKKNILIGFLVVLIPLLALFYTYYQKLQAQSKLNATLKEVNEQKVAALLKDQELQLIKASIEGEEKERKRIAQELHDSIGGNLATIKLQLSSENQQNVIQQIDDTYNQVRDLSHNLMPNKFIEKTFTLLVSKHIENVSASSKEKIFLHIHPEDKINQLSETIKIELYKIIQELLTNALKHAKSSEINIHITHLEDEVKLLFEDDGIGFDTSSHAEGIGLQNVRERVLAIHGTMRIDSHPKSGTIIDIDVPLG